jgi:hypothetical protein
VVLSFWLTELDFGILIRSALVSALGAGVKNKGTFLLPRKSPKKPPKSGHSDVRRNLDSHASRSLPSVEMTPSGVSYTNHRLRWSTLESGYNIRTVRELREQKDLKTTMIYTHALNRGGMSVKSPVDEL